MNTVNRALAALAVLTAVAAPTPPARAQTPADTLLVAAGPQYRDAPLGRLLSGSNWRAVWAAPVRVPVLDLGSVGGGLEPERQGGGNQSITLHMRDAEGRRWIFRSIDKDPRRPLPDEVRGAPAEDIIVDHVSILHPGGHFLMPRLLEAAGVLHVRPRLYVMPDDPALGEFRETFAGMLGELEERANEGPDNTPGFAGSRAVKGTEEFFNDLEDAREHRLAEREFLRARLVDFLVGDPDRGTDQWRWARFGEAGAYTWRPIPVDRDWALVKADGQLARAARGFYPKISRFSARYPSIETLTYSSHIVDRRLLTRLTALDVAVEAERVRAAITDDVIAAAVADMPPEWAALSGDGIAAALRSRRDRLPEIARAFYAWLATDVDVRGTDEDDGALVERNADGSVLVRIGPKSILAAPVARSNGSAQPGRDVPTSTAWYERLFRPDETREVRLYMHGGDDHVRITGTRGGPIVVRVIGGGGDDVLEDLAGGARFYDDRGDNTVVRSAGTKFSDESWSAPDAPEGVRASKSWAPDWGGSRGWSPAFDYDDRAGILLGARAGATRYGFRRLPHRWDLDARALYAPATGGVTGELEFDYRLKGSARSVVVEAEASTIDAFRFHGFGNDSPRLESARSRIDYREFRIAPGLRWHFRRPGEADDTRSGGNDDDDADDAAEDEDEPSGRSWTDTGEFATRGSFTIGPVLGWTDPRLPAGFAAPGLNAEGAVTELGVRATLDWARTDGSDVPRRGFRIRADGAAYPLTGGPAGTFGTLATTAAAYIPLHGAGPHLALRAGAERAFGEFPLYHAAFLGGRRSLRGTQTDRYAGDTALNGAAELRMPLDTVTLLVRTELGVFAFGDVGRVWYEGESPGGWHSGYGAGAWLSAFGRALSLAVARGEGTRLHFWFGLPF